jgi:hypothetical protein
VISGPDGRMGAMRPLSYCRRGEASQLQHDGHAV